MNIIKKIVAVLDKNQKNKALILLILIFFSTFLEILSIGIILPILHVLAKGKTYLIELIQNRGAIFSNFLEPLENIEYSTLTIYIILFLTGLFLFKFLFVIFTIWKNASFLAQVDNELSKRMFNLYIKQKYSFHMDNRSSKLLNNLVTQIPAFTSSALLSIIIVITEGSIFLCITTMLFITEPLGAFLIFCTLGTICFTYYALAKKSISLWGKERIQFQDSRVKQIQESLQGIREILMTWKQESFLKNFSFSTFKYTEIGKKQYIIRNFPRLLLEFLGVLSLAILFVLLQLKSVPINEMIPIIGFFAAASFKMIPSANRLLNAFQTLKFSGPVIDLINKEINLKSEFDNEKNSEINFDKNINLKNINFSYNKESEKIILKNINLKIKKGEFVGFIGESGSGKTTLVDLILGLLSPTKGEIKVDEVDINHNLKSWQSMIGYVPQDVFLTDDTIRKNIAFGIDESNINHDHINYAIKTSQLSNVINNIENNLSAIVGEKGIKLSGGQKQRIGIARALYKKPKILVLDEATSSLDINTEQEIMKSINLLTGSLTIIIISHRYSTLAGCNKIFQIKDNNILEVNPSEMKNIRVIHEN
jgi:ABC-type multidrug transport system fused ATPase/permease subunit